MFTHLVPPGTPGALIALIVIIETIRNFIRPGALAVRLAANIVAGHLLLSLLGGQTKSVFSAMLILLVLLVILECAVAAIQSYVFTILRTLYLNDIIRSKFNKNIV
jgi:F-type H+-transporting ATPase subunit a